MLAGGALAGTTTAIQTAAAATARPASRTVLSTPPSWSQPAALESCAASGEPAVLFPTDSPGHETGPGAIVWAAGGSCPGGAGARVDALSASDEPSPPTIPLTGAGHSIAPLAPLLAAAAPGGQIAISGTRPGPAGGTLLVQGRAGGPFAPLFSSSAPLGPDQMTSAYLGDLAIATAVPAGQPGPGISVRVERFFAGTLGQARQGSVGPHPVSELTVAMDYRSDALLAWAQDGQIFVHDLPASGLRRPVQRLGPSGTEPHIAALLSDDNRGIVMWTDQQGTDTDIYFDYSATGPQFARPQLLERISDPGGGATPGGAPRLVRLSSEGVMAAWNGVEGGRWVVRAAPVDQLGLRTVSTTEAAGAGADTLLSALAPGPQGEAVLLLEEPQGGQPGPERDLLLAARGVDTAPGQAIFGPPSLIASATGITSATAAVDPQSARVLAAWEGPGGVVMYSIGSPPGSG